MMWIVLQVVQMTSESVLNRNNMAAWSVLTSRRLLTWCCFLLVLLLFCQLCVKLIFLRVVYAVFVCILDEFQWIGLMTTVSDCDYLIMHIVRSAHWGTNSITATSYNFSATTCCGFVSNFSQTARGGYRIWTVLTCRDGLSCLVSL